MIRPVIKWSGSKRSQAEAIKAFLPNSFNTYFEPFVGGGSMLYTIAPPKAICGDICQPLIALWHAIQERPKALADAYKKRWQKLQKEGHLFYYATRDEFNKNHNPEDLLFLSRTCVNGLIRFNSAGEFNNSLHYTRKGISPDRMENIILDWSKRIGHAKFLACDYSEMTKYMKAGDLAYLDPPYFHTKGRYYGTIDHDAFLEWLTTLNRKGVKYMLSFDGRRGNTEYTIKLPRELYKRKKLIPSGNSSFKKVMDGKLESVMESLYLNF